MQHGYKQFVKFIFGGQVISINENTNLNLQLTSDKKLNATIDNQPCKVEKLDGGNTNHVWKIISQNNDTYVVKKFVSTEAADYQQLKMWCDMDGKDGFRIKEFHPKIYAFEDTWVVMQACDKAILEGKEVNFLIEKIQKLHTYGLYHGDMLVDKHIHYGNIVKCNNEVLFIDPTSGIDPDGTTYEQREKNYLLNQDVLTTAKNHARSHFEEQSRIEARKARRRERPYKKRRTTGIRLLF
tara:strand:- start:4704 stop:5420 length:717 start_codon:yes stop_codon:yes gene_type:complete